MCKQGEFQLPQTYVPFSGDAEENQGSKLWHLLPSIKLPLLPEHNTDGLRFITWRPHFPLCSSPGFSCPAADLYENLAQRQLKGFTSQRRFPSSGYSAYVL